MTKLRIFQIDNHSPELDLIYYLIFFLVMQLSSFLVYLASAFIGLVYISGCTVACDQPVGVYVLLWAEEGDDAPADTLHV